MTAPGGVPPHRRALTLTTKLQDAVNQFLTKQVGANLQSSVNLIPQNIERVERAGIHLAQALGLLLSTCFDSNVRTDEMPIVLRSTSAGVVPNWQALFKWQAGNPGLFDDDLDELDESDYDDELDMEYQP